MKLETGISLTERKWTCWTAGGGGGSTAGTTLHPLRFLGTTYFQLSIVWNFERFWWLHNYFRHNNNPLTFSKKIPDFISHTTAKAFHLLWYLRMRNNFLKLALRAKNEVYGGVNSGFQAPSFWICFSQSVFWHPKLLWRQQSPGIRSRFQNKYIFSFHQLTPV